MKRFVRLGVVISLCATPTLAEAQSPWGSGDRAWQGSFLSDQYTTYTARRFQDAPQAPEVDTESLPDPRGDRLGSGLADTPIQADSNPPSVSDPYGNGPITSYLNGEGATIGSSCSSGTCDVCLPNCGCKFPGWYGGIYGLYMTRSDSTRTFLSFDSVAPNVALLQTSDALPQNGGGFETRIGHYLSDCWGIEAGYWGFFPDSESASVRHSDLTGDLSSALYFDNLNYHNGVYEDCVRCWYGQPGFSSEMHQVTRSFQAHNIELNLVRNPYRRCGCVHFELLAGVRYLRFDDGLQFSTDSTGTMFGDDPNNELHYDVEIQNNLVGFQIGGRADRYFWDCFGLHIGSKLGIYNNHLRHRQRLYGGNGNAYIAGTNQEYVIDTSDDDIAFLGELFAGASYNLGRCWRLTGGYRAITVCGAGLSTSQIPRDREFANLARAGQIDSGECLLLHGAYFGAEYNW